MNRKEERSYFMHHVGKPPELAVEVVSNDKGGEDGEKLGKYARLGVKYYLIFDPYQHLQSEVLRIYRLTGHGVYIETDETWFEELGFGARVWQGEYAGWNKQWLRWYDATSALMLTGIEQAEQEKQRAEQEKQRAEQEKQRAEQEKQRAEQEKQRAEQERQRAEQGEQHAEQEKQRADQAERRNRELLERLQQLEGDSSASDD